MKTKEHIGSAVAALLVLLVGVAATTAAHAAPAGNQLLTATSGSGLHVTRSWGSPSHLRAAYGWPVKPFDRQHPVRGNLNDPRIGDHGGTAFHFGIDVAAPDGTPVYAVEAGTVYVNNARSICVIAPDGSHEFGYWHIVPVVRSHQYVQRHQLVGHIAKGWGHVHFAERRGGLYLNPLRPGGIGPYADKLPPSVSSVSFRPARHGRVAIVTVAYDMPSPAVPGDWANEPVSPAKVAWRLVRNGHAQPWQTALDSDHMLDAKLFGSVYAPDTRQNHKGEPGKLVFSLDRDWTPRDGSYVLEVRASDTAANAARATLRFTVADGELAA